MNSNPSISTATKQINIPAWIQFWSLRSIVFFMFGCFEFNIIVYFYISIYHFIWEWLWEKANHIAFLHHIHTRASTSLKTFAFWNTQNFILPNTHPCTLAIIHNSSSLRMPFIIFHVENIKWEKKNRCVDIYFVFYSQNYVRSAEKRKLKHYYRFHFDFVFIYAWVFRSKKVSLAKSNLLWIAGDMCVCVLPNE